MMDGDRGRVLGQDGLDVHRSVRYALNFTGDFIGNLVQTSPYTMNGTWQIQAPMPVANGTGSGTWVAELQ